MMAQKARKNFAFKVMSFCQAILLIFSGLVMPIQGHAQGVIQLPAPGRAVDLSASHVPVMLRAIKIRPQEPLVFDFIVDSGDTGADAELIRVETRKLVKYFLASLTIPEKDMWVNLSPYEQDRIVPEAFGRTEMGRDLLAQDYVLKQLTASLLDPEKALGKEFWSRVYARAAETLGTSTIPVDTFNKVWIMPDQAEVYEMGDTAVVGHSRLKVLMEEDYLALQEALGAARAGTSEDAASRGISNEVMRQVVLPEIEKEVNTGRNFALLRQVYQALILAAWYKNNLKESLLAQVYADKNKTAGVSVAPGDKEEIYQNYIAAYRQGVFNYIREDVDPQTNEVLPRKYFSGGADFAEIEENVNEQTRKVEAKDLPDDVQAAQGALNQVTVALAKPDLAEDSLRTASTVTEDDFQELVEERKSGRAGFHLNVDQSRRYVPADETAVLNWAALPQERKRAYSMKQDEMFRQGKIGQIVMAGGEATRFGGPKTFVRISEGLGDFLQVKVNNLKWLWKKYGARIPLYVLSSEKRIREFQDQLKAKDYYGVRPEDFRWYVQGTVDTFIPSDAELEANFKGDELLKYKAFAQAARKANPDGLFRFEEERRFVPAGHFDAIAAFIISGQLSDALARGIEVAPVTNIDNLQAILKDDGILAAFAESGDDFGFILAEKNIVYEVKEAATGDFLAPKVFVRYRDNIISFDGINEFEGQAVKGAYRFVIDPVEKKLDVFDSQGKKVPTIQKSKPETGGTLVQYAAEDGRTGVTMKEGFELPADFDHERAPFFNTNTIIIRLQSLLKFLGVTQKELEEMSFNERSELVRNRLVKQVKANFEFKNHEVDGHFPDMGLVSNGKTKIPVVQLTRIMLQVVQIGGAKIGYIFAPRKDVFAPVKEPEDREVAAKNNEEALKPYLDKDFSEDPANKAQDWKQGGIDFNPAALNLKVSRSGQGIQVQVDPAEIERIRTEGVGGFSPVIINIVPVRQMLPALGLAPAEAGATSG